MALFFLIRHIALIAKCDKLVAFDVARYKRLMYIKMKY